MSAFRHGWLARSVWLGGVVALLAGCANEAGQAAPGPAPAASSAVAAAGKLVKGLTGAQVRELLGAPTATKTYSAGATKGERWSYPFRGPTEVRLVPVATRELPATNPLTGQAITRFEPVYQNQQVEAVDTLHLLFVGDRLIEWTVVREEKKQFQ
jgi:outer membrane protein assembly factor BamE (lipoprotein component of BamABCDE complex)